MHNILTGLGSIFSNCAKRWDFASETKNAPRKFQYESLVILRNFGSIAISTDTEIPFHQGCRLPGNGSFMDDILPFPVDTSSL